MTPHRPARVAAHWPLVIVLAGVGLAAVVDSQAPAVKLLASPAVRGAVDDLGRRFERQTGHRIEAAYEVFAVVVRRIEQGEGVDVAVLSPALTDELVEKGLLSADSRADLGRHGVALGARRGVRLPEIATPEALAATVRAATSVAYFNEGTAGAHFLSVMGRLGLASHLATVARAYDAPAMDEALRLGRIQYVAAGYATLRALPGMGEVRELPGSLQQYTAYTAAVTTRATSPEPARAFLRFMSTPESRTIIARHGLRS